MHPNLVYFLCLRSLLHLTTSLPCVRTSYMSIWRLSHALCTYTVRAQYSKFCFATLKISFSFQRINILSMESSSFPETFNCSRYHRNRTKKVEHMWNTHIRTYTQKAVPVWLVESRSSPYCMEELQSWLDLDID